MEYIFYLTNACNLNCKYCYEHNKVNKSLEFDIIKKLLTERANSKEKTTTIAFFGGEPLLEKQKIYDTINLCKSLEKESGHKFSYSLTTNGTLMDDKFIKFCKDNNIAVGISIDGDKYSHDLNRCDLNSNGSFEKVLEISKKCIETKLNCMALPVICLNNVNYLADNIKKLVAVGFKNITCGFNYSDNWDDNSLSILKEQYQKVSDIYYEEFKRGNYIRIYPLDTKMYFHIHKEKCSNSCNGNRIAVDTDGSFYPCIQFAGDERFKIGNFIDGIDFQKRKELLLKRISSKVICEECSLKDRCIYKCGCIRLATTNDVLEVTPLVCETERIYIKEADELAKRLYKDFKNIFTFLNY